MRKLSGLLLVALLAVTSMGCDSNSDPSDAERFVGLWALTNVSDADGSALAGFAAAFTAVTLTNVADGTATLTVIPVQGPTQAIPATYTVSEATSAFVLTATVGGTAAPLAFTYSFVNDDEVALTGGTTTSLLLNSLFGTTLSPPSVITVTRQ